MRLYREESDRITALIASADEVRLLIFDLEGNIVEEQALDDVGFIYVADVGNNRIQKFAP